MKTILPFVVLLMLCGCASGPIHAVGRVLAPVQEKELDTAAQTMLSDTRAALGEKIDELKANLAKAKTRKPVSLWPIYVIAGCAMVFGPVLGKLLKELASGIILGVSGAASIMALQFMETYRWAMWIPFGIVVALGIWFGVGYIRGILAKKALEAIVPAIKSKGTPDLLAEIKGESKKNHAELMVRAAVNPVLSRLKQ